MPLPSCRQSWLMQGHTDRFVRLSAGGGHGHGAAVSLAPARKLKETVQPVEGNWNEKDLREQFHDCLRDQNRFPDFMRAEEILRQMRTRGAEFLPSELEGYQEILDSGKEHESISQALAALEQKQQGVLPESAALLTRAQIGTTRMGQLYPPLATRVGSLLSNERLHYREEQLSLSRTSLKQQYESLTKACHNTHEAAKTLDEVFQTAINAFRKKSLSFPQLIRSIDGIEKKFEHIDHENQHLKPQYLDKVPVLKSGYFFAGAGKEAEEMRRLLRLRRLLKTYSDCGKGVATISAFQERLKKDKDGKTSFLFTKGSALRIGTGINERTVRILDIKGDPATGGIMQVQLSGSKVWMTPGELYFHLLMETGYRCNLGEEQKTRGVLFVPALETLDDLQRETGFDPVKQPLRKSGEDVVELTSERLGTVAIGKVDESSKTLAVAYGFNPEKNEWTKATSMTFQEFYAFVKKFQVKYKSSAKPQREWTVSPWSDLKSEKPGERSRSLLSIAGVQKAMKFLGEGFKRMGSDRTEVNGVNLARWASKYLDNVPYMHGIMDTMQNQAITVIMGKVDKWTEEYRKLLKTQELEDAFKDFYNLPKWKQGALLLAGGEKGLSKPEVTHILMGEGMDPSKWSRPAGEHGAVGHREYTDALYKWFVDPGDSSALPLKIESRLTPVLNSGWEKSRKVGFEESKMEFESERILDMHRSYYRRPDKEKGGWKDNKTKRMRGWGGIQALLKLGIPAHTLGRAVLYFYSTVESSRDDAEKTYNNFSGDMMRQGGNMGKYLLPMMGLYRFPRGMALARAVIDYYWKCTGVNPFEYQSGKANDAEMTLGHLFSGQWQVMDAKLRAQLNPEQYSTMKYLYYKMRAFSYLMEEGAGLSYHMPDGAEIDEDTLSDAYGVSGMLSRSWLATVLKTDESGSGQADHHNWVYAERAGQWWENLPAKLDTVTDDEAKLFAANFWEILSEDIAVREQHFRRHWKQIAAILLKMRRSPGPVIVIFSDGQGQREKVTYEGSDPLLFDRIDQELTRRHHADSSVYIADMSLPHEWVPGTKKAIGKDPDGKTGMGIVLGSMIAENDAVGNFITGGGGSVYDVDIKKETKNYIKEAEGWHEQIEKLGKQTGEYDITRHSIRNQVERITGDNAREDPWSGGYSESTD